MPNCLICQDDIPKRQVTCGPCWKSLPETKQKAIKKASYRRDELGRKLMKEIIDTDVQVLDSVLASGRIDSKVLAEKTGSKKWREIVVTEMNTLKEKEEIL